MSDEDIPNSFSMADDDGAIIIKMKARDKDGMLNL